MTFIEINEPSPIFRSEQAMSVNGVVLDDEIKGFEVLNVRNREVSGNEHDTVRTNYGVMFLKKRMNVEPLEVEFIIKADSDKEYFESFEKLMKILDSDEMMEIRFEDEEAVYFGMLGNFNELDDNITNQVTGMFEIFRETPFKYSEEKETDGLIESTDREIEIFEIELIANEPKSRIEVFNGDRVIRIIEPFNSSDEVILRLREGSAWKNGERFDYAIAIDSDFENFTAKGNDIISSDDVDLNIKYRERWR